MAVQSPFRSDAIQIENSDSPVGPRLIESRLSDGSLLFTDTRIPTGIPLYELAGLQRGHNIIIVSQTGEAASKDADGNLVTTLQKAIDLVPDSSDENNPWLILMLPGVYVEDVQIVKDYLTIKSLGPVTISPATNQDTIRISQGLFTTPRKVTLDGLKITNSNVGRSCVSISTSQFAFGTITFATQPNIGDQIILGGVIFAAVANGTVPAANEFELGTTTAESAANLVDAIQDPVNGLVGIIFPSSSLNVTTFRAQNPGVAGNLITLVSSVPLVMVPSGPTFSGGADDSSGSFVGFDKISLLDCDLIFTAVTGFFLKAQAVNNIVLRGGNWSGSSLGAIFDVRECALLDMMDVRNASFFELHFDVTALNLPAIITSEYRLQNITGFNLASDLDGRGSLTVLSCILGDIFLAGTQDFRFELSNVKLFQAFDTVNVELSRSIRGALAGSLTATLAESTLSDSLIFAAQASQSYVFTVPQPDLNYQVFPEPVALLPAQVTNKTLTGFDIEFTAPQTVTVPFLVSRLI